jgi:hypothetical protein
LRRDADCRSVPIQGGPRRAAAEIFREDHLDAGGLRVSADRWDESGRAPLPGACPAARRDAADKVDRTGRAGEEIAGLAEAVPPPVAAPLLQRVRFPQGPLPLDVVRAAHLPFARERLFPQAQRRVAAVQSDVSDEWDALPPVEPLSALPPDAVERRASDLLAVRWLDARVPKERRSQPRRWRRVAAESLPARQVSPPLERLWQALERAAARIWLLPPRSSPLPLLPPPPRDPENAYAPVPRARYRSNSSASSFP